MVKKGIRIRKYMNLNNGLRLFVFFSEKVYFPPDSLVAFLLVFAAKKKKTNS